MTKLFNLILLLFYGIRVTEAQELKINHGLDIPVPKDYYVRIWGQDEEYLYILGSKAIYLEELNNEDTGQIAELLVLSKSKLETVFKCEIPEKSEFNGRFRYWCYNDSSISFYEFIDTDQDKVKKDLIVTTYDLRKKRPHSEINVLKRSPGNEVIDVFRHNDLIYLYLLNYPYMLLCNSDNKVLDSTCYKDSVIKDFLARDRPRIEFRRNFLNSSRVIFNPQSQKEFELGRKVTFKGYADVYEKFTILPGKVLEEDTVTQDNISCDYLDLHYTYQSNSRSYSRRFQLDSDKHIENYLMVVFPGQKKLLFGVYSLKAKKQYGFFSIMLYQDTQQRTPVSYWLFPYGSDPEKARQLEESLIDFNGIGVGMTEFHHFLFFRVSSERYNRWLAINLLNNQIESYDAYSDYSERKVIDGILLSDSDYLMILNLTTIPVEDRRKQSSSMQIDYLNKEMEMIHSKPVLEPFGEKYFFDPYKESSYIRYQNAVFFITYSKDFRTIKVVKVEIK